MAEEVPAAMVVPELQDGHSLVLPVARGALLAELHQQDERRAVVEREMLDAGPVSVAQALEDVHRVVVLAAVLGVELGAFAEREKWPQALRESRTLQLVSMEQPEP